MEQNNQNNNNNEETVQKPVSILMEETTKNLADIINNSQLPCSILSYIFKDFLNQIQNVAQQELMQAKQTLEQSTTNK